MKKTGILIIAFAFTLITAYGFLPMNKMAQQGRGFKGRACFNQGARGAMGVFQLKNLTNDQKTRINDIMYNHRLASLDTRNELEKNRLKMQQLMKADTPDESAILNLTEKNGELRTTLNKSRIEMMLAVKELLTPEQLEEFNNMPMRSMGGRGMVRGDRQGQPRMGMGRNYQGDCPFYPPYTPADGAGNVE